MTLPAILRPSDWDDLKLIVFDIDGTLYDQRSLRIRMARDMLLSAVLKLDSRPLSVIKLYRCIRERLGTKKSPILRAP